MKDEEKNLSGDNALKFIKISFELRNSKLYKEAIEMLYKALSCSDVGDGKCEIISQIGSLYADLKNYERAIEQYEKVLDIDENHKDTLIGLCDIYITQNDYDTALSYAKRICNNSDEPKDYLFYFKVLYKLSKFDDIMNFLNTIPKNIKEDSEIQYIISKTDTQNKKNILENLIKNEPNNLITKFDLAEIHYNLSDYEISKKMFKEILEKNQNDKSYYYYGMSLYNLGDYKTAIDAILSAIKLCPNNCEYYYHLSRIYIDILWYDEAYLSCKKSIELSAGKNNEEKKFLLSWLDYKLGKFNQANLILSDFDKTSSLYKDAKILEGIIKFSTGDISTSMAILEDIIVNDPKEPLLYSTLGQIYKNLQYVSKAIDIYKKGLIVSPNSIEFALELADLYIDNNELDSARKILDDLSKRSSKILPVYNSRARIYYKENKLESALDELFKYINLDKNNAEVFYFSALIANDLNLPDIALSNLNIALSISPSVGKYYSQISRAYEIKHEYKLALTYAKEACIVAPNDPIFYQRALDLAVNINSKEDIKTFSQKVRYFKI